LIGPDEIKVLPARNFIRMRWVMWLFLIALHLITSFHRVSFNVVADLLTAEFNLTGAGLGNLAAAYTYMYVIMQIPGGVLVDRLGSRRIAILSGLAMAAGSLIIGFSPTAGFVFLGRMLIGLGGSVVLINIFKFQASWFRPGEFATMSGFALLVSGSGALLAATPLAFSVSLIGWRSSFLSVGLGTVVIALLSWVYVRCRPRDCNLEPDYTEEIAQSGGIAPLSFLQRVASLASNRLLWMPFLINFGTFSVFIVFSGTWGVSYIVHVYDLTVEQASTFMILTYLGYMVSAPAAGWVSDRIGSRKKPAIFLVSCAFFFWLVLAAWPGGVLPLGFLYLLCVVMGVGGASSVLTFPMAREVSPPGYTGSVTAAVNLGVFLGLAILQPLFGFVLDLGWEGLIIDGARIYPLQAYRYGFLVCLFFTAVALAAVLKYRDREKVS
jgi:MFS family permease